jgi:ribosomal protein S9
MSGISGVGGYNASVLRWLAQSSSDQQDPSVASAANAAQVLGTNTDSEEEAVTNFSIGGLDGLRDAIRAAVSSALQEAEKSDSTDLKKTIQDAVEEALKDNGIDPAKFKARKGHAQSTNGVKESATQTGGSASQTSNSQLDPGIASLLAQFLGPQMSSTNLVGFLFDSGQ